MIRRLLPTLIFNDAGLEPSGYTQVTCRDTSWAREYLGIGREHYSKKRRPIYSNMNIIYSNLIKP